MSRISATFAITVLLALCASAHAQWGPLEGLKIDKPEDLKDIPPVAAPEGAIALFNGKDLDNWTDMGGKSPAPWKVENGVLEVVPGKGNILSKRMLEGDFKLHVEFRIPYLPNAHDQSRGNSGVYLQGRYEIQVLDAYHNDTYKDGMCGAIYSVEAPSENVAKAPTVWQSYDIEFHSAKFENGKKTQPVRITVFWNGVKVHDNTKVEVNHTTAGMETDPSKPGPLMLQDHGSPDQFRNIWMVPLK